MKQIIRILIEDILVFAYCNDNQISEDFSVAQLERIAGALGAAGADVIDHFIEQSSLMAIEARSADDLERARQLELMPSHLGLV